eukprot:TRINITY_DN708_c0_g1_i4.p1 TRINITY_DN708_c0_g1~~TRINITY_DN708_c0_g1_i4.p1  ORF type:complete len:102 (-),score=39.52 TRINITY_DN708_c0_g1_i4:26-331(-)
MCIRDRAKEDEELKGTKQSSELSTKETKRIMKKKKKEYYSAKKKIEQQFSKEAKESAKTSEAVPDVLKPETKGADEDYNRDIQLYKKKGTVEFTDKDFPPL